MREVYVLGVGQTVFGRFKDSSAAALGAEAARAAIKDAGISPKQIQVGYGGRVFDGVGTIEDVLMRVGVTGIEMHTAENACASGASAVNLLYKDIAMGMYDMGIAVGCEYMSGGGGMLPPIKGNLFSMLGVSMPALAAFTARRLIEERGATAEDLAFASWKNHRNACLNPYAHHKKELTVEEIISSRMVADPITLLECCPTTDGAAAVILCTKEMAQRYTTTLIKMAASVIVSAGYERSGDDLLSCGLIPSLSALAYARSGIGPEELNVVELHDAFSPEELYTYELMGFCPKGEGVAFARSGATELGGRLPVNPSGGLQSLGHPLGASGTRVVCEVTEQLKGNAGERQVSGAKAGLAQMVGGYTTGLTSPSVGVINILTK